MAPEHTDEHSMATAGAGHRAAPRLRHAGLRVTAPRVAVLEVLTDHPGHHAVGDVALRARRRLGSLSTQAAYDVLHALVDAGLAQRIELPGHPARFEARTGDNHHHLVCRRCGAVRDVDCAVGEAPCLDAGDLDGFALESAEVTWWGLCAACHTTRSGP